MSLPWPRSLHALPPSSRAGAGRGARPRPRPRRPPGTVAFSDRKKTQLVFVNGASVRVVLDGAAPGRRRPEPLSAALEKRRTFSNATSGTSRRARHPFIALNTSHLRDGVLLHVAKGIVLADPVSSTGSRRGPRSRP